MKTIQFGYHLTLDLYGCPLEKLNNQKVVYDAIDKLSPKIKMHPMIPPYVFGAEPNDKKDPGGYTGFQVIQESHISIHTFSKRGFVSIDVYSCSDFNPDVAKKHFIDIFEPKETEAHFVNRGVNYPAEDIYA